jgi:hypothetical protein
MGSFRRDSEGGLVLEPLQAAFVSEQSHLIEAFIFLPLLLDIK